MRLQWKLVDVETKAEIPVGPAFEVVDLDLGSSLIWHEAMILFGEPQANIPIGVINMKKAGGGLNGRNKDSKKRY